MSVEKMIAAIWSTSGRTGSFKSLKVAHISDENRKANGMQIEAYQRKNHLQCRDACIKALANGGHFIVR